MQPQYSSHYSLWQDNNEKIQRKTWITHLMCIFALRFVALVLKKLFVYVRKWKWETKYVNCLLHPFYLDVNHFAHHSVITISELITSCRMLYGSGRSLLNSFWCDSCFHGNSYFSFPGAFFLRIMGSIVLYQE